MQKTGKSIFIIPVASIAVMALAAIALVIVLLGDGVFVSVPKPAVYETVESITPSEKDLLGGVADVTDYGAVPNDETDDTMAFRRAAATGLSVFVPAGEYRIGDTITVKDGFIAGSGMADTRLRGIGKTPVIALENGAGVKDLTIVYDGENAAAAQAAAIRITPAGDSRQGSYVKNVSISHVGTGIVSETEGTAVGETYENVHIRDFSRAAISLTGAKRLGTSFSGIYCREATAENGVVIADDSNTLLEQLVFDGVTLDAAAALSGDGFVLRTLTVSRSAVDSFVLMDGATGVLGSVLDEASSGTVLTLRNIGSTLTVPMDFLHLRGVGEKQTFGLVRKENSAGACTLTVLTATAEDTAASWQRFPFEKSDGMTVVFSAE